MSETAPPYTPTIPMAYLTREAEGIFFFEVHVATVVNGRRHAERRMIAVSAAEARLARVADFAMADDAPVVERARYLAGLIAQDKFKRSLTEPT